MKEFKIQTLLIVIFLLISSILIPKFGFSAQKVEKKKGYKGKISKETLLSELIKVGGKPNESVEGYVITGHDIIKIMEETDYEIKIKNSIIEGGLDFTRLPPEPLEKVRLPKDWTEETKDAFIRKKSPYLKNIRIVENRIQITNSEIRSQNGNSYSVNATSAYLKEKVSFDMIIFSEKADFWDTIFRGEADFSNATFSEKADFSGNTFSGKADFSGTTFSGKAHFRWTSFSGKAYFWRTGFRGMADFSEATFRGDAFFSGTTFSGMADFSEATFRGDAFFSGTSFARLAYFKEALFDNILDVSFSKFKEYADFRDTKIGRLDFNNTASPTILEGRIDLRKAIISEAHFQDIIFEKDVDFSDVTFGEVNSDSAVVFRYVTFENDAYFLRTKLYTDTAMHNVNFKKGANFTGAEFQGLENFSLSYVNFNNLIIGWKQIPNPAFWLNNTEVRIRSFSDIKREKLMKEEEVETRERSEIEKVEKLEPLSQALKGLETNFRNRNQLSDANKVYYHMKNAELREGRGGKVVWQWLPKQVPWIIWGITCGYGTQIYRILAWCILFDLLFTIIYFVKGNLKRDTKKGVTFKLRLFDFPRLYLAKHISAKKNHSMNEFFSALRLSSVVLFKIGYRDTTVSGKIIGIDFKYVVWIEWALGFYILACIVITLSNTLPIVNRLITGVF